MVICRPCAVCGKEGSFRCSNCRRLYYCSKEHQQFDWKTGHKSGCRIFSLKRSEILGRYLVSKVDLEPGALVIAEDPLVSVPPMHTKPVCLGCFGDVGPSSPPCEKCGWPMCSQGCAKSPLHKPECTYTNIRKVLDERSGNPNGKWKVNIREFSVIHPMYHAIPLLRCLYLRDNGDKAWDKFIKLESHDDNRKRRALEIEDDESRIVKFTIKYFCLRDTDEADLRKIYGILMINGHEVPRYATDSTIRSHVAVYDYGSILEHNCLPNCAKRFPYAGGMEIRATESIPKGSRLSISYTDPLWGTVDRQKDLCLNKYFFCTCARCEDPTECGCFLCGIKCRSCPEGYCVPFKLPTPEDLDDLDKLEAYEWQCVGNPVVGANKEKGCGNIIPFVKASKIIDTIGKTLSSLDSENLEMTQQFLRANSQITLHKNHQFLISARFGLLKIVKLKLLHMGEAAVARDPPEVNLFEVLCQELLEVLNVLSPGVTEMRGVLLYEMNLRYLTGILDKYKKSIYPKAISMEKMDLFREGVTILSCSASTGANAVMAEKGRQLIIKFDEFNSWVPEMLKRKAQQKN